MAKFTPDPDERILDDRRRFTLQGGKVKFPVRTAVRHHRQAFSSTTTWQQAVPLLLPSGNPAESSLSGPPSGHSFRRPEAPGEPTPEIEKLLRVSSEQGGEST